MIEGKLDEIMEMESIEMYFTMVDLKVMYKLYQAEYCLQLMILFNINRSQIAKIINKSLPSYGDGRFINHSHDRSKKIEFITNSKIQQIKLV